MDWTQSPISPGGGGADETQECAVTTAGGLVTKIERIDKATHQRTELSREEEEYAGLITSVGYAAYYAGIRDTR